MSDNKDAVTVKWSGDVLVDSAAANCKLLLNAFSNAAVVYLDLADVQDIDAAGLQLMIAAKKEAKKLNKQFYVLNTVPTNVVKIFETSGVQLQLFQEGGDVK